MLPTGDEDITSGAVSEHDQAIIDRKRELRGGVDFEDITSGAVESTPEGYEQHPSGLVVPTASAIPGDMKPTGDEDVTSGAVREQAMRTRAFGEDIRNMARNAAGFGQDYVYKVLHSTAVGAGQVLGAAHKPAWAVHDKITGQTSDKDPVARSYEQIGTIPEASKRVAEGYGLSVPEDHLLTKIPVIKDMPLLSLAPGQDLARAAEDRRIQGSEWIDAATAPIDVLPLPLATGIGQGVKAAKSVLPTKLGGGFIASTSPDKFVPRLMGSASDHAVLDASIDARRQLATTGEAKVTIGGQTYVVDQTRLDEALRKANPDRHLSTTAATDVSVFEKGGPVPTLYLPDGRVKPPAEQFQYRTLGGTGVLRFADDSALGHAGSKHKGLVVYGDDVDSLAIPGTRGTTLDTNYYAGGRELEGGVPTEWHRGKDTGFTPGETAPVRRATGIGGNKGLYLDENLENPSYAARVGANVKALADKAKTPFADSGPAVRRADADEIARGQFGKNVDELTETEAAYVKHAQMDDSALTNLAGQGDETAIQILDTRKSVQGALDDARDAARRDTGGYYQRDSGVYAPYSPPQGMPAVDTEDFATGDDSPATPRGEGVEGGDGVAATRSDSAAPGRRYEGEGGYDDGIDPETGLLREDFATGDSPAAPRDDGTVRDDGTGLDDGTVRSDDPDDDYGEGDLFGDDGTVRDDGTGLDDGTVRSDDPDDDYGEGDLFGDDGTVRDDGTGLDDGTVRSDDPDDELGFESFGDDGTVRDDPEDPDRPPPPEDPDRPPPPDDPDRPPPPDDPDRPPPPDDPDRPPPPDDPDRPPPPDDPDRPPPPDDPDRPPPPDDPDRPPPPDPDDPRVPAGDPDDPRVVVRAAPAEPRDVVSRLPPPTDVARREALRETFKRARIRDPRPVDGAPPDAPKAAPRPPGTHAREIAHTEAIEYRYDPEGDSFDARVVEASEPIVTRWDADPPARDPRDVGRWDVVPHSDGVDAVDSGRVSIPEDVRDELRARAAQTGAPVSSTTTLTYTHDLDSRETTTDLPARRDNAQVVRESGDVGLQPQYQQMSEQVLKAQENKPGRNGTGQRGKSDEVDLSPQYQQMLDRLLKAQENKSSKNRRRASRSSDLKERGYKLPQIQIIQEPTSARRIGGL